MARADSITQLRKHLLREGWDTRRPSRRHGRAFYDVHDASGQGREGLARADAETFRRWALQTLNKAAAREKADAKQACRDLAARCARILA